MDNSDAPYSPDSFSHRLRMTAELMDLLSSTSTVDHPMCQECCDALTELLESQLRSTESEVHSFKELLSRLQAEHHRGREASIQALEEEVRLCDICCSLRTQPYDTSNVRHDRYWENGRNRKKNIFHNTALYLPG